MPYCLASCMLVAYMVLVPVSGFRVFFGWYCGRGLRVGYPIYFLGDALLIVGMYSGKCLRVPCLCVYRRRWDMCVL